MSAIFKGQGEDVVMVNELCTEHPDLKLYHVTSTEDTTP